MAKDKFVPIDPSILNEDDASAAPTTAAPVDQPVAAPTEVDPNTAAAANTSPLQRSPEQQGQLADFVAREQDGQNRQALVKAAELIKKKYPEGGDRYPEPGSQEDQILKAYEQEYGQGNLKQATDQANMDSAIPTVLKPLVAAGQGALTAVDQAGYAMGVGSGEFKPITPGGTTGHVTKSVAQFVTGMAATLATMNGQGISSGAGKLADAGRMAVAGGVSGAFAQDPHEVNLSNLVEQHSSLLAPIADYMAAKPEDTEAVARTKKFFENAGLGLATDGLLAALKYMKLGRAAQAGDRAAAKALPDAATELKTLQSGGSDYLAKAKAAGIDVQPPKPILPDAPQEFISAKTADKIRESVDGSNTPTTDGIDFNFDHLPDKPDAKQIINQVSQVAEEAITEKTGGVQTLKETEDVAAMVGAKPADLIASVQKLGATAKQQAGIVVAGKSLLVNLAQKISDQSNLINTMVRNGVDTSGEEAKLLRLMNIHADLQVNLKGAITGAARTTGAGRIDVKEAAQLFAMADGNPVAIGKLVRPLSTGEKIAGVVAEWRANALLSGVTTLAKKSLTDLYQALAMPVSQIVGGTLHADLPAIKQGAATLVGLTKSIGDAFSMARMSLNNGTPFLDAGAGAIENPRHFIASTQDGFIGTLVNALGTTVRFPTRLIGTLDEFSKQLNYRAALYAQASREGATKGLTGANLASYVEDFASKAFDETGRATNPEALQYAKEATFTQDLDYGIGKWLQDGANAHPVVRAIVPFVKVPTNLFRKAIQYTPGLQHLDQAFREDLAAGGARAARARGTQVIGAALYAQAVNLATSGRITGSGPQDPQARKALLETGWQPYSFKVGDKYISFSSIEPLGTVMGLVGDFAEAAGQMNNDTAEKTAVSMTLALAHNITSKTYYAGMVQTLDAMRGDPAKAMKLLQGFTGSFVPNTRQFTDILPVTQDPYMRECRSILDGIRKKIPGLSQTLAPNRNIFGEAIHMPAAFGPDTLSPFHTSEAKNDDLLSELAKFPKGFSLPSTKDGNVDLTQIPSKEGGYDAYDRLLQLNGQSRDESSGLNLKERLNEFIHSDEYKALTDDGPGYSGSKFEGISAIIAGYRRLALGKLREENPQVRAAIRGDLENRKAALSQGPQAVTPISSLINAMSSQSHQ